MKLSLHYIFLLLLFGCQQTLTKENKHQIESNAFSTLNRNDFIKEIDQKKTDLYLIKNQNMSVAITNFGGRIVGCLVPDKNQKLTDVVVGFNSIEDYQKPSAVYFGALIGRVGNRISKGQFTIDEKTYQLEINNGENTLHGGIKGFHNVVWDVKSHNDSTLVLTYLSPDGEENFPGNLNVEVTYSVTSKNTLSIDYRWSSDQKTIVNLTNHAFFNLNGEGSGTILNHVLKIDANTFTSVNPSLIPDGAFAQVENTPFDFRQAKTIGQDLTADHQQLINGNGYDHNFNLNKKENQLEKAAYVIGDQSGIRMDVYTTEPGIQLYGGNFLKSKNTYKNGQKDDYRTAFCLETQHLPDTPNQENFPSITVLPDSIYTSKTMYHFEVDPIQLKNKAL
ncbi:aldose epimerase family protein [Flammeovirga pacifica]|uniref:Aldose 1-epimerase n=1 Tax=Flammeovirga pacifica TaxID=915059 RepID=A0A1S1YUH0_FLAPC|nr:aldose epimerase family protein [Flammeovirga pacifica]OHX64674.1 hypothetical protein NH26_24210 [Flammeovirga pacifica]